ncbi:MAG: hypothetical protein V6Z81_08290 [Parvularculales bacterium]
MKIKHALQGRSGAKRQQTLAAYIFALVTAFAFSGPVVLTATPADAMDRSHCWGPTTGYSQCEEKNQSRGLLDDMDELSSEALTGSAPGEAA